VAAAQCNITAPIDEVFRVLANGWLYPHWAMGPRRVHMVDRKWPEPGSRFLHSLGRGPIQAKDLAEVIESDPPRRLALRVRGWPAGLARFDIQLLPIPGGTRVSIREKPERGVALAFRLPLLEEVLGMRLREMLRRLSKLAERADFPDAVP
jgi:uncharacterized protein YndB with AHSA1/START domain